MEGWWQSMIGRRNVTSRVTFETLTYIGGNLISETIQPWEEYGMRLVSYTDPPPVPQIYRVTVEGRNGTIDMTEWAGEVFYADRTVTIILRDFHKNAEHFMNRILGRQCRIYFEPDHIDYYFQGRCEEITPARSNNYVTELTMKMVCHPFRYPVLSTPDDYIASSTGQAYSGHRSLELVSEDNVEATASRYLHQSADSKPVITVSGIDGTINAICTLTINDADYVLQANGVMESPPLLRHGSNTFSLLNEGYSNGIGVDITFEDKVI